MISDKPLNNTLNRKRGEYGKHLVLLGCGKMGSAMLKGWLQYKEYFKRISIIEPAGVSSDFETMEIINCYESVDALVKNDRTSIDFVVLAVKPQMMKDAIAPFTQIALDDIVFLSIAAGLSSKWLEGQLGGSKQIVRAMPNTPASIGAGITAVYANEAIQVHKIDFCISLLEAVGEVIILPNEEMMDAVTALSGSGPAYVFLLAEAMQIAGTNLGLPDLISKKLARGTVFGAGTLLDKDTADSSILRENVTSKGGTTAAALSVLMQKNGLVDLVLKAMRRAEQRSRELGQ